MKVIWSPLAKTALRDTARYIRTVFGKQAKDEFMLNAHQTSCMLGSNPKVGKVEPLLNGLANEYRSFVVNRINKIVYCIIDDHIEVVDFWDVRREPKALVGEVQSESH